MAEGTFHNMKRKRSPKKSGIDPKVLMDYDRWVSRHFDELVRKYPGQFIAVYRGKLVAVGSSHKEVYERAVKRGVEEPPLTMQVPAEEDLVAIL